MATFRTSAAGGASSGTGDRTAVLTPAVGDLWIVFAYVAANTNDTPTCSDNNSGTYTRIDVANCVTSTINYRLSCFVRDSLFTNTTSTTVTAATGSNTSGVVVIMAISGMTRTGSSAIRSKGLQSNQAAGTAAPTLNQSALTGNVTLVAHGSADTTTTPPTNWTEAQDSSQTNDAVSLETAYRDSGFTGTTITFNNTSSTTFCSMALELDTSLSATGADSLNNWGDARTLGYGLIFADNASNLSDAHLEVLGLTFSFADDLNAWGDDLAGDIQPRWLDTLAYDLAAAGGGELALTLEDNLNAWGDDLCGDLNPRWRDGFAYDLSSAGTLTQSLSDSLNNWNDDLCGDLKTRWQDAITLNLASAGQISITASDSFSLTDGSATIQVLSYDILVYNQDLNNWADGFTKLLSSPNQINITASDSFTLTDGTAVVSVLSYDVLVYQDLNNWNDTLAKTLSSTGEIDLHLSDSLNNWNDSLRIGYGLLVSDLFTLSDSIVVRSSALTLTLSDSFTLTDSLTRVGYGLKVTDQVVLTDAFQKSVISGGFAVWQNIAAVTLNAASLAAVTLLTQNTGNPGDVMYRDTDTVTLITEDTDSTSVHYEDTDTAAIKYEDTDVV